MAGPLTEAVRGMKALVPVPNAGWSAPRMTYGLMNERDYASTVGDGTNSSIVEAVMSWVCLNFPEAPLAVYKYADENLRPALMRRHPLAMKVARPNPYYSGVNLMAATIFSWIADGNAYWLKRRDVMGRILEYWYVPHWMIEPVGPSSIDDKNTYVDHYQYVVNGQVWDLKPSEVYHLRFGLDPSNPRKGRSRLKKLLGEIATDEEARRWSAAMLINNAVPGLVITPTKDSKTRPTQDEKDAIKNRYMQEYTGDRRGEPIVMSSPTEVHQFGYNPKDLDLASLRDIPEERVTAVLGIPAAVIGLGPGSQGVKVGRTLEEFRDQAWESNLIPTGHLFGAEAWIQLLPDWVGLASNGLDPTPIEQIEVGFDLSRVAVLQEKELKKSNIVTIKYRGGVIDRAEARADLGYPVRQEDIGIFATQAGVTVGDTPPGNDDGSGGSAPTGDDTGDDDDEPVVDETGKAISAVAAAVGELRDVVREMNAKAERIDPNVLALIQRGDQAAADRDVASAKNITDLVRAILDRPPRVTKRRVTARNAAGHIEEIEEREADDDGAQS